MMFYGFMDPFRLSEFAIRTKDFLSIHSFFFDEEYSDVLLIEKK